MSDPELERILRRKMERMTAGGEETLQSSGSVNLSTQNFDQTIGSSKPVIVDFWAEWCGPCRFMHPVFERLASRYAAKAIFGRLNVDENPSIAARYEVYSIPTFVVFQNGAQLDRVIGAVAERTLEGFIERYASA